MPVKIVRPVEFNSHAAEFKKGRSEEEKAVEEEEGLPLDERRVGEGHVPEDGVAFDGDLRVDDGDATKNSSGVEIEGAYDAYGGDACGVLRTGKRSFEGDGEAAGIDLTGGGLVEGDVESLEDELIEGHDVIVGPVDGRDMHGVGLRVGDLCEGGEEATAFFDDRLLSIPVPMDAGEWSSVDLDAVWRLEGCAVAAAWRPFDLAGGGAGDDEPCVSGSVVAGGELNLDTVFECDPGADCERYAVGCSSRTELVPAADARVERLIHLRDDLRHGDGELLGCGALNLEEIAGLIRNIAEEVGVVGDLDPLVGGEAEVGVGAEGVDLNVGAEYAGDGRFDASVLARPFEGGLGLVAALMDFDAVELIFETAITCGRSRLAGAVAGTIAGLCRQHAARRFEDWAVHGGAAVSLKGCSGRCVEFVCVCRECFRNGSFIDGDLIDSFKNGAACFDIDESIDACEETRTVENVCRRRVDDYGCRNGLGNDAPDCLPSRGGVGLAEGGFAKTGVVECGDEALPDFEKELDGGGFAAAELVEQVGF